MKIYFAGAIRGGRDDRELYADLVDHLQQYGDVLTEHVADDNADHSHLTDSHIYDRDMTWVDAADVIVAEVTTPSLGVGYELRHVEHGTDVLCLYRPDAGSGLSAMISGNPRLPVREYTTPADAKQHIDAFLDCRPTDR